MIRTETREGYMTQLKMGKCSVLSCKMIDACSKAYPTEGGRPPCSQIEEESPATSPNIARDEILRCITYIDNHLSAGNVESARKWCNEVRALLWGAVKCPHCGVVVDQSGKVG